MALTKADMAEKLFDELGLNKREAKELVELHHGYHDNHYRNAINA